MATKILPKLRVVFDLDDTLVQTILGCHAKVNFKGGLKSKVHKLIFHDKIDNYTQEYNVLERPHLLEGLDMIKDSNIMIKI